MGRIRQKCGAQVGLMGIQGTYLFAPLKGRIMTETEAVLETIKMWEYIAEHPECSKWEYLCGILGLRYGELPIAECFLCEEFRACDHCPLNTRHLQCGKMSSPWNLYYDTYYWRDNKCNRVITHEANRIVRACKRWLKKKEG